MRNISSKTDNVGDTLPASDFNANLRIELQAIVTDAGFTLDIEGGPDTDLDMLGKSITVYSNASQYYSDAGAVNAYVLSRVGDLQPLEVLKDGAVVMFKAANSNTGASTLKVDSLTIKDLVKESGAALTGYEIIAGTHSFARYNLSNDNFELIFSNKILQTWENVGDDLRPITSGVGTLGDASHLVEGAFFGDSSIAYFGNDQDLGIYHDGSNAYINSDTGYLLIGTGSTSGVRFVTNSINRWFIDGNDGDLIPFTANTYDIGSPSNEVANLYQGDNGIHYLGSDQDAAIYHDGSDLYITSGTGGINITATDTEDIFLKTSNLTRWQVNSAGHLQPFTTDITDLGGSSNRLRDAYFGTDCYVKMGSTQQFNIYYNATNGGTFASSGHITSFAGVGGQHKFGNVSTTHMYMDASGFLPNITATYDLGSGSLEWDNVYCVTLVESSDRRKKDDIGDCLGLDFILNLTPKSYRFKDKIDDRKRHGIIAQDLEECLNMMGIDPKDFAALAYNEKSDSYGIAYTQLIGPIIQAIKELNAKIN